MAGADTLEFNEENFDSDVISADKPVLVDFWAEWCGPCKALGPVIDDLATEYKGKVNVGKLDIDSANKVSAQYTVSTIPTVILFNKGEIVERVVGLRSKKDFQAILERVVGSE